MTFNPLDSYTIHSNGFSSYHLALGRKNWLFGGNEDGGEAAAVIFSLVQSCRGLGINPREYLEDVMRRLMAYNAQKLNELLPDQWAEAHK
jgi:transposase